MTGAFCAEHPEGRSGKRRLSPFSPRYLCVVVLFGLGLMCKPMLVTLPLVLLLLDYWPLERIKITDLPPSSSAAAGRGVLPAALGRFSVLGRLVMEKVPLLLLSGASSRLTVWAANKEDKLLGAGNLPYAAQIANVPVSCVAYLRQFFYPVGLAPMYPWEHADLRAWKVLGAVLVLAAVTVGTVPVGGAPVRTLSSAGFGISACSCRSAACCKWESRPGRTALPTCRRSACAWS